MDEVSEITVYNPVLDPVCRKYELVWAETAIYEQGKVETLAKEGISRSFSPAVYGLISNEKKLELLDEAYLNLRTQIQIALVKENNKK